MSRVKPPELALWACTLIRKEFAPTLPGLQVDIRIPDAYRGQMPLIVVRDDGGAQTGTNLFDRSLGVTVSMGSIDNPYPCRTLADGVYALLTDLYLPFDHNPIAAIIHDGCNGPYPASGDHQTAVHYLTVEYSAVGTIQE